MLIDRNAFNADGDGFVLAGSGGRPPDRLDAVMRKICKELGITRPDKVTPHDLRRAFGTSGDGNWRGCD